MKNQVKLVGVTTGVFEVNHRFEGMNGELITALETEIVYTSANHVSNTIKVIVLKDSIHKKALSKKNKLVSIEGALHTFNKDSWGKRIKEVFVSPTFVKEVPAKFRQQNSIELVGTLCGDVNFKTRSQGKQVAEGKLKIAKKNGFDYIPIVAFGTNALILKCLEDGGEIQLKGRIHSRTFSFKYEEDGEKKEVIRTALEVGIHVLKGQEEIKEGKDYKVEIKHPQETIFPAMMDYTSGRKVSSKKSAYGPMLLDKSINKYTPPNVSYYNGQGMVRLGKTQLNK